MADFKKLHFRSTALQAIEGTDLTGKTSVVSGSNSGIGVETVRALASAGSRVILTSRSMAAGEAVAKDIKASGVKGDIVVKQLDLADLASVDSFAKDFLATEKGPHLLILNAGVMACPLSYTKNGFEMQIGTNHFGHFKLANALLPSMKKLGTPARVVAVSSKAHTWEDVDLEDLHYKKGRKYGAYKAYGQSKTANILFAKELARRCKGTNIKAFSLHPGGIMTNLGRHIFGSGWFMTAVTGVLGYVLSFGLKTPEQGASTTIVAAISPDLNSHSGAYLDDCQIVQPIKRVEDMELAKKLWEVTEAQLAEAEAKK